MMRIAIVARQITGMTGMTGIVLEHTRRLSALGWELHLFAERLDVERIRSAGGVPHRVPAVPIGGHAKRRFFAWAAHRAARSVHPDLIWGQGDLLDQDILSLHNCVHAAHEAVHRAPLPPGSAVGALHTRVLSERRFRLLIANSQLMKRELVRRFGVPEERVRVVYPGYDPARFRPQDRAELGADARRRLDVSEGQVLVGLVTSGDFEKRGVRQFLAALDGLPAALRSRVRGVVVGHDSRWRASDGATRGRVAVPVDFVAPIPEVERYYHALDLLVHPALHEEFGMTVLEAMACGTPVLTSARVGASELLGAVAPDLVIDAPESQALRARLEALVEDAGLRQRWAGSSLRAARGHTWDDNLAATRQALESLVDSERD